MNRQQAHDKLAEAVDDPFLDKYDVINQAEYILDDVYDDIESRVCGNCDFGGRQYCNNPNSFCVQSMIEPTDGCNQFESAK